MKKTIIMLLLLNSAFIYSQVPESEFEALKALYRAWNLAEHPECNWDTTQNNLTDGSWWSIWLSDDNHVQALSFHRKNISGYIPEEIGDLPYLSVFNLIGNPGLTGPLPSTIENLDSVGQMNFYETGITSIPPEIIYCESMTALQAGPCPLGSIPPEIGNSTKIVLWGFTGCNLTEIPENLKNLHPLSKLWVNKNDIENLPVFDNGLEALYVGDNYLQFDDLEPNINKIERFYYAPQKPVRVASPQYCCAGNEMRLLVEVGGSANRYRWLKDGVEVQPFSDEPAYVKPGATPADAGTYTVEITNELVPGLTLQSEPIEVIIGNPPPPLIRHNE